MKNVLFAVTFLGLGVASINAHAIERGDPARGEQLSTACAACHNPDGNSTNPQFPRIAGQYADYMVHVLKAYKNGDRKNPIMNGIVSGLSEKDMEDLAAYFASQQSDLYQKALD